MRKNPKSQKLCSPAAELIMGNDFFLGLVLRHLPVRSLARFKSVSKQWCDIISDSQFRRSHSLENPSSRIPSGFYLYNPAFIKDHTVYSISSSKSEGKIPLCSDPIELPDNIPFELMQLLPQRNIMRMVQSCNGLNLFKFNTFDDEMEAYCVRNLVTNEMKLVPLPNLDPNHEWIVTYCLAFDPLVSPHYKVICAKAPSAMFITFKFMVFSSETGQWKDTNVTVDGCELECAKGEYCHGAIYWIVKNNLSCYRFDIEAENLTQISMPPKAYGSHFRHFGECNGHLYLACVRDATAKILNVYELDQVTMKWVIKHWVHVNRLISSFPQVVGNARNQMCHSTHSVLCVLRGEEEDGSVLVLNIHGTVVSYNMKSKKAEVLQSELRWNVKNGRVIYAFPPLFVPAYPFVATLYPL